MATTVYADASGSETEPIYLVGGWLNSVDHWNDFGREWREFLHRNGITCFHQVRDKRNPANDAWKRDPANRHRVCGEAEGILRRSGAISIVFFTQSEDFAEWKAAREAEGDRLPDCFAWNAFRFVSKVDGWCQDHRMPMPEFIFESMSNKIEEAQLRGVMEQHGLPDPIFREKMAEDPQRTVVALQAADFLAYEVFRGWKDLINKGQTDRPHLHAFAADPAHDWGWADRSSMDSLKPVGLAMRRLEALVNERVLGEATIASAQPARAVDPS